MTANAERIWGFAVFAGVVVVGYIPANIMGGLFKRLQDLSSVGETEKESRTSKSGRERE